MVIADMLIENRTLSSLVLDDNPVGKRGGRAILRALRSIVLFKMERQISLRHCNFDYQVGSECSFGRSTQRRRRVPDKAVSALAVPLGDAEF